MLAVLNATGEAGKLRPLTEMMPSPMVPVVDKPAMAYVVELLARHDIKKIIVSLHHFANQIEAYFGNGQRWGVSIEYVLQKDAWGTAGALKWAEYLLTETFLVMPADAVIDVDVNAVLAQHRARNSRATIVVHPRQGDGNPLFLDENDRITAVAEATTKSRQVYDTGVYIMEPSALEYVPERARFDLSRQLIPSLLKTEKPLYGYCLQGFWNPLRSLEDHQLVQRACLYSARGNAKKLDRDATIRYPSIAGRQVVSGIWIGPNNSIHPSARLAPPVYIGKNCHIGRDVELGPEAVVGANVIVNEGATIQHSTVLERTHIGQYVNVDNRIVNKKSLINVSTAQNTYVEDDFLLGEVPVSIASNSLQQGFDVLIALLLLLLTLPLTFFIALLLRLVNGRIFSPVSRVHSWGSSQRLNGDSEIDTFKLLRFSTRGPDDSYTSLGQILESWELHRLPELWNVARGEIMLVGVKPLEPHKVTEITEPWQKMRYEYSTGLTGLWYTQTVPHSPLDEILIADTYYVATRTGRDDLRLLWHTPGAWFRRRTDR